MIGKIIKGKPQFGRLVRYLTNTRDNPERVVRVVGVNVAEHGDDPNTEAIILEVDMMQDVNERATAKTMHIVLTFREQLSLSTLAEIERDVVEGLGYGDHSRVSVVHGDKGNRHLHLAISKVYEDESTGHVLNRHLDHGKRKLDRICVEQELKHGLIRDKHRYKPSRATERALTLEREQIAGQKLATRLRAELAPDLAQAEQWSQVHELAAQHGVHLQPVGANGLRLVEHATGTRCKASEVYRSLSRGQLEKRLGAYQPALARTSAEDQRRPQSPVESAQNPAEALLAALKATAAKELRQAQDWPQFHDTAAQHGLRARPRAGGLVFDHLETGITLRGSAVNNHLSLSRLEKRLGNYQPSQDTLSQAAPTPQTSKQPAQPTPPDVTLLNKIKRSGAAKELRSATDWNVFHEVADKHHLRVLPRTGTGAGALMLEQTTTGAMINSSAIGDMLSLGRLHTRLGAYQPPAAGLPPEIQVREEVVALATQRAAEHHERRRRSIADVVDDPEERARWFDACHHTWSQAQRRIQVLHALGRYLPRERANAWLRNVEPSPIARIRQYVIDTVDHLKRQASQLYHRVADQLHELKQHFTDQLEEYRHVRRRANALQQGPSLVAGRQTTRTNDVRPLPELDVALTSRDPSLLLSTHVERNLRRNLPEPTHHSLRRPPQRQLTPSPERPQPTQQQNKAPTPERQRPAPERETGRGMSR